MTMYFPRRRGTGRRDDGYVMLILLLTLALMIIFAAAIVPSIAFDIKRDREDEMIHRGTQYSRAIKAYYKKFGRYPTKIEDLESANNLRFLRKRYKDPLNCKDGKCEDFKLLHFGEVQLSLGGIGGGGIAGATPVSGMNGNASGGPGGGFSQPSSFGGSGGFGANSNSSFGQSPTGTVGAQTNPQSGTDPSQPGSQPTPDATGTTSPSSTSNGSAGSSQIRSGQIIGGPIIGVASIIKDKTIREFNHKNKYKDWVFAYDPAQDQGRLITTPYQPQLQGFGAQPNLNGQNGTGNSNGPGFGNSFGNGQSGMQNNQNQPSNSGFGTPQQPPSTTPQQQQQ